MISWEKATESWRRNFDCKVLPKDKRTIKKLVRLVKDKRNYPYIEIQNIWYDNAEHQEQEQCDWIDIEGMGYGWLWIIWQKKYWRKNLGGEAAYMLKSKNYDKILFTKNEDKYFILLYKESVLDIICVSKTELYWF